MSFPQDEVNEKRRLFLKNLLKKFFLFSVFLFSILGLSFLKPSNPKKRKYVYYEIDKDKIPKEGVKKISIDVENMHRPVKIYIIKRKDSIIALSPVCTHLGCFVNFDKNSNEFVCPCHGGRYDIEGKVIAGPPKEPLHSLPVKLEDKKVYVGILSV